MRTLRSGHALPQRREGHALEVVPTQLIQFAAVRTTGWTAVASTPYKIKHRMIRRRTQSDPLAPSPEPRWYVVRSMHGTVLEARELPRGVDAKRAFVLAMLEWIDAGWSLGEFSSASATFFCDRHPERRMVSIDPADPHEMPHPGGAHLGACPTCSE